MLTYRQTPSNVNSRTTTTGKFHLVTAAPLNSLQGKRQAVSGVGECFGHPQASGARAASTRRVLLPTAAPLLCLIFHKVTLPGVDVATGWSLPALGPTAGPTGPQHYQGRLRKLLCISDKQKIKKTVKYLRLYGLNHQSTKKSCDGRTRTSVSNRRRL